jgi:hypothetical protein
MDGFQACEDLATLTSCVLSEPWDRAGEESTRSSAVFIKVGGGKHAFVFVSPCGVDTSLAQNLPLLQKSRQTVVVIARNEMKVNRRMRTNMFQNASTGE